MQSFEELVLLYRWALICQASRSKPEKEAPAEQVEQNLGKPHFASRHRLNVLLTPLEIGLACASRSHNRLCWVVNERGVL